MKGFFMLKIHVIRHGESIANTEGRYQGQTYDTDLSSLGRNQVDALKKHFSRTVFDEVFSSPLKRTLQTASGLSARSNSITLNTDLLETNHGHWEGMTVAEIKRQWPEMYKLWQTFPSQVLFPQGESFLETYKRSVNWLNSLKKRQGIFAAVTHSNIIFALLTYVLNRPLDSMWQFQVQPTSISTFTLDNENQWKVNSICETLHLPNLQSNLLAHAI